MVSVHPARRCTSLLGVVPVGLGDGVGHCHDVANILVKWLVISFLFLFWEKLYFFSQGKVSFWRVIIWMLHIGGARHPGPGPRSFAPGQLSIEFNVGGWLTYGDLALDSCAQFLAIAEHRLILAWAWSVCHQLRRAGYHSVWAPACQDQVAGGHAGVGVVSLGGVPLSLPSFVTPQFQEFFKLGRVLRTTLPAGKGGVVHLFVVFGFQGAEEDADQLQLTDKLLQARLRWFVLVNPC